MASPVASAGNRRPVPPRRRCPFSRGAVRLHRHGFAGPRVPEARPVAPELVWLVGEPLPSHASRKAPVRGVRTQKPCTLRIILAHPPFERLVSHFVTEARMMPCEVQSPAVFRHGFARAALDTASGLRDE